MLKEYIFNDLLSNRTGFKKLLSFNFIIPLNSLSLKDSLPLKTIIPTLYLLFKFCPKQKYNEKKILNVMKKETL